MNFLIQLFSKKPRQVQPGNHLSNPRYAKSPIAFFFESYILDVLGQLTREKSDKIQSMNLQKVFKTQASEWRDVIRETLHLSSTIDIAILDLWYTNREIAKKQGTEYTPLEFAQNFNDEYQKDGSKVDVWTPETLQAAKARIAILGIPPARHSEA